MAASVPTSKDRAALLAILQATLPQAIESCSGSQQSQSEPVVEKLRVVLLSLLQSCPESRPGEHSTHGT